MDSKYFGFPANPPPNFHMWSLIGLAGAIELVGSLLLLVGLYSREAAFRGGWANLNSPISGFLA